MKIINTKVHGMLDYLVGIVLILSPWIWGLDPSSPEGMIFIILGVAALLYSLLTDYELGAAKVLSMRTHLALDAASGIILAASPWLLGFTKACTSRILYWACLKLLQQRLQRPLQERTAHNTLVNYCCVFPGPDPVSGIH
jgi:hypothetical protein